jgi:membrane-bound lytic murein transglycosylase MltF
MAVGLMIMGIFIYLFRRCREHIGERGRLPFALGSYNAGFENVSKAYRKALEETPDARHRSDVTSHVPGQTGHHVRRSYKLMRADLS